MSGHGHVTPNANGAKARCGGPSICGDCAKELARLRPPTGPSGVSPLFPSELHEDVAIALNRGDAAHQRIEALTMRVEALENAETYPIQEAEELRARALKAERERDHFSAAYYRLADAVAADSNGTDHLCSIARETRDERDRANNALVKANNAMAAAEIAITELKIERDRLRVLLDEASRRIVDHHADGFRAVAGNVCSVCKDASLFVRIEAATRGEG